MELCELLKRRKLIQAPYSLILDVFRGLSHNDYVSLPRLQGVEEGTQVLDIWPDQASRTLTITVVNPSFPTVPDGCIAPTLEGADFSMETIFKILGNNELERL